MEESQRPYETSSVVPILLLFWHGCWYLHSTINQGEKEAQEGKEGRRVMGRQADKEDGRGKKYSTLLCKIKHNLLHFFQSVCAFCEIGRFRKRLGSARGVVVTNREAVQNPALVESTNGQQ